MDIFSKYFSLSPLQRPQRKRDPNNTSSSKAPGHLDTHNVSPNTTAPNPKVPKANIPERNDSLLKDWHIVEKPSSTFVDTLKQFFETYFTSFKMTTHETPIRDNSDYIETTFSTLGNQMSNTPPQLGKKNTISLRYTEKPPIKDPVAHGHALKRIGATQMTITSDEVTTNVPVETESKEFFSALFQTHKKNICEDLNKQKGTQDQEVQLTSPLASFFKSLPKDVKQELLKEVYFFKDMKTEHFENAWLAKDDFQYFSDIECIKLFEKIGYKTLSTVMKERPNIVLQGHVFNLVEVERKQKQMKQLETDLNTFGFTLDPKKLGTTTDTGLSYLRLQDQYVKDAKRDRFTFSTNGQGAEEPLDLFIENTHDLLACAKTIGKDSETDLDLTPTEKQTLFLRLQNLCVQQTVLATSVVQILVCGNIYHYPHTQKKEEESWKLALQDRRLSLTYVNTKTFENASGFLWDTGRNGMAKENLGLTVSMPIEVLWQAENPTAPDLTYDEVTFERSFSPDQTKTVNR